MKKENEKNKKKEWKCKERETLNEGWWENEEKGKGRED